MNMLIQGKICQLSISFIWSHYILDIVLPQNLMSRDDKDEDISIAHTREVCAGRNPLSCTLIRANASDGVMSTAFL